MKKFTELNDLASRCGDRLVLALWDRWSIPYPAIFRASIAASLALSFIEHLGRASGWLSLIVAVVCWGTVTELHLLARKRLGKRGGNAKALADRTCGWTYALRVSLAVCAIGFLQTSSVAFLAAIVVRDALEPTQPPRRRKALAVSRNMVRA